MSPSSQAQIWELEARFFDLSLDMLCILNYSGYFQRLSRAWETTLGWTRVELMSKPFIEFVHPDDRERTLQRNGQVRSGGEARSFENRYLCKDGSYRWLLWNSTPDPARQVIYGIARDVTERKQADQEREKLLQKLQTAIAEVKTLREILPFCSYCKRIRDEDNSWHTLDVYLLSHTNTKVSHGVCPECYAVVKSQLPSRGSDDFPSGR